MTTMAQAAQAFDTLAAVFPAGSEPRRRIAALKGVPENEPGLDAYLLVCITHDLDPALGGLDLLPKRTPGVDGAEAATEGYEPYAGRDVLLEVARKDPRYRGLPFGVVRANDRFSVEYVHGEGWKVTHKFAAKPKAAEGVDVADWRGDILGAWAALRLHGVEDTFHYVELREKAVEGDPFWDTYTSEMVLKAAQSYVCRIGIGITGIVPADELAVQQRAGDDAPAADITSAAWDHVEWGADEELAAALQDAVDDANRMEPYSWSEAKVQMVLAGRTDEDRGRILNTLRAENDARRERLAAEQAAADGPGEVEPADAAQTPAVFEVSANEVVKGDVLLVVEEGDATEYTVARVEAADGGERRLLTYEGSDRVHDLAGDEPLRVVGGPTYERLAQLAAE